MKRNFLNILVVGFLLLAFYLQIQSKLTHDEVAASANLPSKIQSGVATLAFSPDGNNLASADESGRITLWDVASGKQRSPSAIRPAKPSPA